jgi:hypothetical protein
MQALLVHSTHAILKAGVCTVKIHNPVAATRRRDDVVTDFINFLAGLFYAEHLRVRRDNSEMVLDLAQNSDEFVHFSS